LQIQGIVGVHAMNKNELLAAIKEAKGIVEEKSGRPRWTSVSLSRRSASSEARKRR